MTFILFALTVAVGVVMLLRSIGTSSSNSAQNRRDRSDVSGSHHDAGSIPDGTSSGFLGGLFGGAFDSSSDHDSGGGWGDGGGGDGGDGGGGDGGGGGD
jgi:hypothetical protein